MLSIEPKALPVSMNGRTSSYGLFGSVLTNFVSDFLAKSLPSLQSFTRSCQVTVLDTRSFR